MGIALSVTVCIAALLAAAPAEAQPAADAGAILFCSGRQLVQIRPDASERMVLARIDMSMQDAALSPDGGVLLWVRGTSLIRHLYIRLPGADAVHLDVVRGRGEGFGPLRFRTGAPQLLYSARGEIKLLDAAAGSTRVIAHGDRPQWLGNGPQFIYETGARGEDQEIGIHLASVENEDDELIIPYGAAAVTSPDGRLVAYISPAQDDDPKVYVMEVATREPKQLEASTRFDRPLALSPDGGVLVTCRADLSSPEGMVRFDLVAFRLADGSTTVLDSGSEVFTEACISPDGTTVCFVARRGGETHLYLVPIAGGEATGLSPGDSDCRSPRWYTVGAQPGLTATSPPAQP
jgi:WD40 repeat protein